MALKEDDSFRSFVVVVDDVVVVVVVVDKSKMMSLFVARASVWLAAGGTNPSTGRIIINDDANIINAATMPPAIGVDDGTTMMMFLGVKMVRGVVLDSTSRREAKRGQSTTGREK